MYLMIDNYDSFTYNLYALFKECNVEVKIIKNNEFIPADNFEGIIISPGPSSPKNSGTTLDYLKQYKGKKPIFGVCLGMQCIAHEMGYDVIGAKTIKHGKVDEISISKNSVLLNECPEKINVVRYHSLAVDIDDKYVIAQSEDDGVPMAIEDVENMLFGVQFHPESILSENGKQIVQNFINFTQQKRRTEMDGLIKKTNTGTILDFNEAETVFEAMMSGALTDVQIASILISMKCRGETADELAALVLTLNKYKKTFNTDKEKLVDTCGTGGDGKSTVNVSTAVSVILASMGYNIVKHGNSAQSGKVGSADILIELGLDLNYPNSSPEKYFDDHNFVFMFAPYYHPALKNIGKIRRELKVPTIFNFVGPLVNPANPDFQVIGINSIERLNFFAEAIQKIGKNNITVYSSEDGYDEISSNGITECRTIKDTKIDSFAIDPSDYFKPFSMPVVQDKDDAKKQFMNGVGNKDENLVNLFSINTALVLKTMGEAELKDGFREIKKHIQEGKVLKKLETMVNK